ncbi:zona pellucida sperm-binding protein 1 [Ornithorhynchus anatinus]|uniref:Zona pellucida glycoprotein 1 n=1 Tax=Ornithorhynchus anatinus TaxID=9258 RepID=A0A6I8N9V6_ORNAN|nr:zona pellucida sperm-binding protein 1 [Ornithorhynchus anatinus]
MWLSLRLVGGGWSSWLGLLLLVSLGPCWGFQHVYDCGNYGMQLLVFPRLGRTVRFKVVDEFGTRFEVTNCSICLHWITSDPQGTAVFSAGYKGCHVLKKEDGRYYLRVYVEELLANGAADGGQEVQLICPKPTDHPQTTSYSLTPEPSTAGRRLHPGRRDPLPGHPSPETGHFYPGHPSSTVSRPYPVPVRPSPDASGPRIIYPPFDIGARLTPEQCVVDSGHIPCTDGRSSAACVQAGCCYDDSAVTTPCYYGNTVTVQCFRDGRFALAVARGTSENPVVLDSVRVAYAQEGCGPTQKTEAFVLFHFSVTECGTTAQVAGNRLIYENQLVSGIDVRSGPDGSITRDGVFILHARCIYNASDFLPIQAEVFLSPTPGPVVQTGPLRLELRIAMDRTYGTFYTAKDYPVIKVLRDPVSVEVRLLQRTDPNLELVLHHCWATPSTNPFREPQWPILLDGCPYSGDSYQTRLVPAKASSELLFPTHRQRFVVTAFTFVDSDSQRALRGPVYFFCSASVCYPSELESCKTVCHSGAAKRRRFLTSNSTGIFQDIVSSQAPVDFRSPKEQEQTLASKGSHWRPSLLPALWLVLSLVAIVALMLVLVLLGRSQNWLQKLQGRCGQGGRQPQ